MSCQTYIRMYGQTENMTLIEGFSSKQKPLKFSHGNKLLSPRRHFASMTNVTSFFTQRLRLSLYLYTIFVDSKASLIGLMIVGLGGLGNLFYCSLLPNLRRAPEAFLA